MRGLPVLASVLLAIAGCGGNGGDGTGVSQTASLSGTVRDAGAGAPLTGATVSAAGKSAVTGADGRYQIQAVPVSASIIINVSAPGFDAYSQTLALHAGQNTHDVALDRKTMYEDGDRLIYLMPGIDSYRGVIFDLPGSTADSRPLIRGDLAFYQAFPLYGDVAEYRRRLLLFAQEQRLAAMGTATFTSASNDAATYDAILGSLTTVASESGHAELASAPLLLYGHSLGACVAYGFTRLHSDRVIGFISGKGGGCLTLTGSFGAKSVPGYFFIGEEDPQADPTNVTQVFEAGRAEGAPWALVIEPGADHTRTSNFDLIFNWMATALTLRLPSGTAQPAPLRTVAETSGWLANRSTGAVAGFACYNGDKTLAGWLPSEQTARDWQAAAGKTGVVTSC